MQAGELDKRITIQYDASDGTTNPNWQPLCTVWASKKGLTGRTFYQAAATHAESDIIYKIRYRTGIKALMQIVDRESTMTIKAPPVEIGRKQWLEIHAKDVLINGG